MPSNDIFDQLMDKLKEQGIDPLKFIIGKSMQDIIDYLKVDDIITATEYLVKKKNRVPKLVDIKEPNLEGKVGIIIEDSSAGKDFWQTILGDSVRVLSPSDFNKGLSGAPAIVNVLWALVDNHKYTYVVMPDSVDRIRTALSDSILFSIYEALPSDYILIHNYISFEWMFVYAKACKEYYSNTSKYIDDYLSLEDLCTNKMTELEYNVKLRLLGKKYIPGRTYTLENVCKAILNESLKDTDYQVVSKPLGRVYTYDKCLQIVKVTNRLCRLREGIQIVRDLSLSPA